MILSELIDGKVHYNNSEVKFDAEFDLIVCGLGTAGAIAALSAAENGASVLGIEQANMCGGTATAGGVFGYYYGLPGGLFEEIDAAAAAMREDCFATGGSFHPDAKSIELEQRLLADGVRIEYESSIAGVFTDGNGHICGVRAVTPDGLADFACKVLIDASGEGQICAMAGAEFEYGRDSDGKPQPFSSIRIVYSEPGRVGGANFDAGYMAPVDGADLSRGVIAANALHRDSSNPILSITTIPGGREGRLITCDARLRFDDFMSGERCDKPVALCYSNFDSHTQDWAFEENIAKDWMVAASLWGKCFVIPVPLEAMLVKGFDNLMAVGRCLSVDHLMACAVRMQRGMQKLGEAAGITAALATAGKCSLREVEYESIIGKLRDGLVMEGQPLPDCSWPEDSQLEEILGGDKPGEAIWTMARNIATYKPRLLKCLASENRHISANAALALGLAGCGEAMDTLRDIVSSGDDFVPASSRSHNQARILGAIHLLGSMPEQESIGVLMDFAHGALARGFQELSHTLVSLIRLGDAFEEQQGSIAETLNAMLMDVEPENCRLLLKNCSTGSNIYEPMDKLCRHIVYEKISAWGL